MISDKTKKLHVCSKKQFPFKDYFLRLIFFLFFLGNLYFIYLDAVPQSQKLVGFNSYDYGNGNYDTGFDDNAGFDYYN